MTAGTCSGFVVFVVLCGKEECGDHHAHRAESNDRNDETTTTTTPHLSPLSAGTTETTELVPVVRAVAERRVADEPTTFDQERCRGSGPEQGRLRGLTPHGDGALVVPAHVASGLSDDLNFDYAPALPTAAGTARVRALHPGRGPVGARSETPVSVFQTNPSPQLSRRQVTRFCFEGPPRLVAGTQLRRLAPRRTGDR